MEHVITDDAAALVTALECAPVDGSLGAELDLELAALKILEANRVLRQHLLSYDCVIQESLEKYRSGMRVQDVVRTMPPADAAIGSEVEVVDVFEARRALRKTLVTVLLVDGMPVEEVAATLKMPIDSVSGLATEIGMPHE